MKSSISFRLLGILAFALVLGILWIFLPDNWQDWLFCVNAVLLAFSISRLFYLRIGRDPATSAVGFALVERPLLIGIAVVGFVLCLLDWRKASMSVDLIWCFVFIANFTIFSAAKDHIAAVQQEHSTSHWYEESVQTLRQLSPLVTDPKCQKALRQLQDDFRFSNKINCSATTDLETRLTADIAQLADAKDNAEQFEKICFAMKQSLAQRNSLIAQNLNSNK